MKAIVARIDSKYQVVIPKEIRERMGLKPGSTVLFVLDGDTVTLRPRPQSYADALRGLHAELWEDAEAWLEEERSAWEA